MGCLGRGKVGPFWCGKVGHCLSGKVEVVLTVQLGKVGTSCTSCGLLQLPAPRHLDPTRHTNSDALKAHIITFEALLEEEEEQIRSRFNLSEISYLLFLLL